MTGEALRQELRSIADRVSALQNETAWAPTVQDELRRLRLAAQLAVHQIGQLQKPLAHDSVSVHNPKAR